MNLEPLFLKPVFQEKIWGGSRLRDHFRYSIPSDQTGECWAIAAHSNGDSIVQNGHHKGWTLSRLWKHRRELFGKCPGERFPLLTKIIDARDHLSVQVHPGDSDVGIELNESGKTECWYVLDCNEGAELIIGHHARTLEELEEHVSKGNWDQLLKKVPVQPGEFFYIPGGTVHAIGKGVMVLETQQNSDMTYRLYDYDRVDQKTGQKRELHLDEALKVIRVPHRDYNFKAQSYEREGLRETVLIQSRYFSVYKWEIEGEVPFRQEHHFLNVSVIEGHGTLEAHGSRYPIEKGAHLIIPGNISDFVIHGKVEAIVSHP